MRAWLISLLLGILPVPLLPWLPPPGFVCALALVAIGSLPIVSGIWRSLAGMVLGAALAMAHGHWLLQGRLPAACVGQQLELTGRVSSLPRTSALAGGTVRQRFEFAPAAVIPGACEGVRRVLLSYYGEHRMQPGQWWRFTVRLKKPWGLANPGSFNLQAWFAESGIGATGSVSKRGARELPRPFSWKDIANRERFLISERIRAQPMPADVTAILAAITVADKSGINARLWSLLQLYGINHLLVISGLHIGLVAAAGFLAGRLLLRLALPCGMYLAWLPAVVALTGAGAYAALAGFAISTQRALCMLVCFLVAGLLGRRSSGGNSLLLAALSVLLINPLALLGSGMWLSFGAVATLLWLGYWQRGKARWQQLFRAHVCMSLVMLPLGGWFFSGSSLVAPLANLVLVPLVGLLVVPLALLAVVAMYLFPALENALWALAAWPLEQLLPWAQRLASGRHHWLYWQLTPSLPAVVLGAIAVALVVMPLPTRLRGLALLLLVPLLLPVAPASDRDAGQDGTQLTVLDVGQGTAVVLRSAGRVLVYDTGGGDPAGVNMAVSVLVPFLRRQGVSEVDTLIVSHPDNDHSAGTAALLAAVPVQRFFYGGEAQDGQGVPCVAGQAWQWPGGVRFQFLSPGLESDAGLASNNASCVLQVEAQGHRLLLTGDIEATRERELVRYWGPSLASDWLLLPHHGSATSSTHALIKHVRPAVVANSSGYANRFGHPHAQVLERVYRAGARYYDTADSGALSFEFRRGEPIAVSRYRRSLHRFWM